MTAADRAVVVLGEISDSQCAFNVHSSGSSHDDVIKSNVLGHTPAECTRNCVRLGGKYVLVDTVHKKVYDLANSNMAEPFAANKVRIKGAQDANDVLTIISIDVR
jgi:hypothetical protein